MAEKKDEVLRLRVTKEEKETVKDFCERHSCDMSAFIREAMVREMRRRDGKDC